MGAIETGLPEIYVQPGESYVVSDSTVLRTVLGSCIGIVFYAGRKHVAGFCHPMLPRHPGAHTLDMARSRRYVDFAIRDLLREFESRGVRRNEITVKVFGGADVLKVVNAHSKPTVGKLNSEAALQVLGEEGLKITASKIGGKSGLTIKFNSDSGDVLVRRLSELDASMRAAGGE